MAVQPADPDSGSPGPGAWPGKLIIRYIDGTVREEFFREAPHDYAVHLSMLTTVDSVRSRFPFPVSPDGTSTVTVPGLGKHPEHGAAGLDAGDLMRGGG